MNHPAGQSRKRRHRWSAALLTALAVTAATIGGGMRASADPAGDADGVAVSVQGNQLVDGAGHPLQLVGVDRSGTEYACVQGWGIFDGPSDAASITAMAAWHINAVRIPLNEDCWLGINGVAPDLGGPTYQHAIVAYVHALNRAGIVAILDLHWGAPGTELATGQEAMPDADHAGAFWSSVAATFAPDPGVIFDLFNEPHDISQSCWLDGCTMPGGWQAVGMQSLIDTVRATGATQPIMVEPTGWGGDLSGWLADPPVDPDHALIASAHIYNFSGCNTIDCWASVIAPVAAVYPVVTGEVGENDCSADFVDDYTAWANLTGVSYLAWAWDAGGGWSCASGPSVIDNYDGMPNVVGEGLRADLEQLAAVRATKSWSETWGDGGVLQLTLTNTGDEPVGSDADPWTVRFALPAPATVTGMWNADLTGQGDGVVTATAPSSAPVLQPGQAVTIGLVIAGMLVPPRQIDVDGEPTAF